MRRLVLLCRHGNTFDTGEKVVMVGANQDLSLTAFGREQAERVGRVLGNASISVERVVTGPLRRTREYSGILVSTAHIAAPIVIDPRLLEIDYGDWGGLSDEEIARISGEEALRRWHQDSIRPHDVLFTPSEEALRQECTSFLHDLESGPADC